MKKILLITSSERIAKEFLDNKKFITTLGDINNIVKLRFHLFDCDACVISVLPKDYNAEDFILLLNAINLVKNGYIFFVTRNNDYSKQILSKETYKQFKQISTIANDKNNFLYLNHLDFLIKELEGNPITYER